MIGVDHIEDIEVLRAKFKEVDARQDSIEAAISLVVQNMTISVTSSGFAVITQATEPPHPSSGTLIWQQERAGLATVYYISGIKSDGSQTWLWLAETQ